MNISLTRKKVVVTGATGIVGQRIAMALATEGADLLLVGRENTSDIAERALGSGATTARYMTVDLSATAGIMGLIDQIGRDWGAPDVLINNAGLYPMDPLLTITDDKWDYIMAVNLRAPFILMRELSRLMIDHSVHGSIINIVSGAAYRAKVGHGHYSTSKAALEMLTKSFALELAPFSIRVNGVGPGFAPGSENSLLSDEYVEKMAKSIPLGRVSGEMDAAAAILFLVSSQASFITGTVLAVDGGRGAGILTDQERDQLIAQSMNQ